jgi:hypothetical protein
MRIATPCFMALAPKFTTSAFPIPNYFTFKNLVRSHRDWEKKWREGSWQRVLSGYLNLGAWLGSFDPGIINCRSDKIFFKFYFNDTISERIIKTIYSGLRITGMALSDQSDFMQFWSPESHLIQLWRFLWAHSGLRLSALKIGWMKVNLSSSSLS